jgi:hypothetical protein
MQPSSRRVGRISARSSASKSDSWPRFGRRITTSVTAFFGSLALVFARALRFAADFTGLRFATMAGLYPKKGKGKCKTMQALAENGMIVRAGAQTYCDSTHG